MRHTARIRGGTVTAAVGIASGTAGTTADGDGPRVRGAARIDEPFSQLVDSSHTTRRWMTPFEMTPPSGCPLLLRVLSRIAAVRIKTAGCTQKLIVEIRGGRPLILWVTYIMHIARSFFRVSSASSRQCACLRTHNVAGTVTRSPAIVSVDGRRSCVNMEDLVGKCYEKIAWSNLIAVCR
jgi:hypothetical protein